MRQIEIRVRGQIDRGWSDWFGGLIITHTQQGESTLTGMVRDQSALYGVLTRVSDLGLELISVTTRPEVDTHMFLKGR